MIDKLDADGFAVSFVCDILGVGRSGYYAYCQRPVTQRELCDDELRPLIQKIFWQHSRRYGVRRIRQDLAELGEHCGDKRISRLMKEMRLQAIGPRSFRPRTTQSRHTLGYSPNLLLDAADPTVVNQVWVGDITYIPLKNAQFAYLAVLMDLYSRRIVGWDLCDHMKESLTIAALKMAIAQRQPSPGLICHSDRGGQYAGNRYRRILGRAGIRQSMSRADNCYDNAFMESCFGTIKTELDLEKCDNTMTAKRQLRNYIGYYNVSRRHSALGYLSPARFEKE